MPCCAFTSPRAHGPCPGRGSLLRAKSCIFHKPAPGNPEVDVMQTSPGCSQAFEDQCMGWANKPHSVWGCCPMGWAGERSCIGMMPMDDALTNSQEDDSYLCLILFFSEKCNSSLKMNYRRKVLYVHCLIWKNVNVSFHFRRSLILSTRC